MLTEATVMAQIIQVFLQVTLLCYVVTTSIGGIIDYEKAFAKLEKKVDELHHKNEQLEKRVEQLEAKGQLHCSSLQPVCMMGNPDCTCD